MSREKVYATLVGLCVGLFLIYFLYEINWLLYVIPSLLFLSLVWKWAAEKIAWVWLKFGEGLGWINSRILLSVIFFVVLTPMALIRKLFSKDEMKLKRTDQSTFHERNHTFSAKDLKNPW